jgi:small subunit ribosomal protein S1
MWPMKRKFADQSWVKEELVMTEDMNQVEVNNYKVGDQVKGTVSKVEEKQVIVDCENSKTDGIIPISELSSLHVEKASDAVSVGDVLELEIIKVEEEALIGIEI